MDHPAVGSRLPAASRGRPFRRSATGGAFAGPGESHGTDARGVVAHLQGTAWRAGHRSDHHWGWLVQGWLNDG